MKNIQFLVLFKIHPRYLHHFIFISYLQKLLLSRLCYFIKFQSEFWYYSNFWFYLFRTIKNNNKSSIEKYKKHNNNARKGKYLSSFTSRDNNYSFVSRCSHWEKIRFINQLFFAARYREIMQQSKLTHQFFSSPASF